MVTVSTPTKPSSTRRSLRSSSAKSGSATPARKARASRKAQAARPSGQVQSGSEETSGAETKIAEPATQKATAEPGRVEEPDKAPDNRTGTLVTTVDKYNDLVTAEPNKRVVSALHYKAPIERPLLKYYRTSQ